MYTLEVEHEKEIGRWRDWYEDRSTHPQLTLIDAHVVRDFIRRHFPQYNVRIAKLAPAIEVQVAA